MSPGKKLIFFAGLMVLVVSSARAGCTRLSTPTVKIDMQLGRVVISPDAPKGSVLASRTWNISNGQKPFYRCSSGTYRFVASIVNSSNLVDLGNKVHSTNVPGIGLRFSRGGDTIRLIYPDVYTASVSESTQFYLEDSWFKVEVIKTADVTGSGPIKDGIYTRYDWDRGNNPELETFLTTSAITLIAPSCTVSGGNNMNVDIGTIKRSELNGVGTTAGGKDFDIRLRCSGGPFDSGVVTVYTTFSGKQAADTPVQGVLINEKSGNSAARGIGVQVLKEGNPLKFGQKYKVASLVDSRETQVIMPFRAQFYQYASSTRAGEVESHMTFNITYE